uniref:Activin_recp domain-containing protein n=1 Tax=Haemonchus contortus TaxID=6289 RepID=A0A7I5E5D7_HAECO
VNMIFMYLLVICFTAAFGRYCADDQKVWCRGHEIWGWCFHNKTNGKFDCDDDGFCASQEQLKKKRSSGCFIRENNTVCCCNEADGCNLGFIAVAPKYSVGQQCVNTIEEPGEDLKLFRACDDPWCFAFLTADVDGGLTTAHRGCRSRKTMMHHISKDQDKKFNNNTKWMETERFVGLPSCSDITWDVEYSNGTQSMCLDFFYEEDEVEKKGKLCCCRGQHKCNEKFLWGDESISEEELAEKMVRKRSAGHTTAGSTSSLSDITVLLGFMIFVKFF